MLTEIPHLILFAISFSSGSFKSKGLSFLFAINQQDIDNPIIEAFQKRETIFKDDVDFLKLSYLYFEIF